MKILVTGATGFIGKHLTKALATRGNEIVSLVRPTTNTPSKNTLVFNGDTKKLIDDLQRERFDGIIHLASLFLPQHKDTDIKSLTESNIFLGTVLLEAATLSGVKWFINTGTFWQHFNELEYSPVNLYAATKEAFIDIAQYYTETTPLIFCTLKLSDTFGQNDTRPKIFALWEKIAATGEMLEMSPGEQKLDILHVDDVVSAYIHATNLLNDSNNAITMRGKSYALYAKERYSLKELSRIYEEATTKKLNIVWGARDYRPREIMAPWRKGEPLPGWSPALTIREGISLMFSEK